MSGRDTLGEPQDQSLKDEELFAIIDETGEGFGFELTPEVLAKPLAIGTCALFGLGMMAGVPFGLAMGRSHEGKGKGLKAAKVRPSLEGFKFAATTFGLGTLLCGAMGLAGFYGIKSYYDVETFEEFGNVMKQAMPIKRHQMEAGLKPVLDKVRQNAGDSLPGPMRRLQERFLQSRLGLWIKDHVDVSVAVAPESYADEKGDRSNHIVQDK